MDTTQVILPNGSRVYIIEHVLAADTLAYAHSLADTFAESNPLWHRAGTAAEHARWEYDVADPNFDPIRRAFDCPEHLAYWQQRLAPDSTQQVFCSNISFFIDYPGSPPLFPHVEAADSWLSQVYIARQPHKYNGTTVYNDRKQILFQLPYRDNMGWLFNTGGTVMHGRAHAVPEALARFSLMIWYALLPDYCP
jgi:hypothetical protein